MSDYKQYTIRKVPNEVDARLKAQAKKRGLSLNKLLLDKLGALPKQGTKPKIYHDLDFLIGTWKDDPGFEAAMEDIETVDPRDWQ